MIRIGDVRRVWVTRRTATRGSRLITAALGLALIGVVPGGAAFTGWLSKNWIWLLTTPLVFLIIAWVGLLDPLAIYLEKRYHELWVATDTVAMHVYRANSVEAHKARRAIERAIERHWDSES